MSEYHGAVGLAQIERWSEIKKWCSDLFKLYVRHLEPLAGFVSLQPPIEKAVVSSFMLLSKSAVADAIVTQAKQMGMATHRAYLPPLYRHPYFENLTVADAD